jgi:hypothetical protein
MQFGNAFGHAAEHGELFVVRVYAGGVNALTGTGLSDDSASDKQGYLAVPKQRRLDGFRVANGISKQFVAMPLGFQYTAEHQILGHEFIGGLQLEITPRMSTHVIVSLVERYKQSEQLHAGHLGLRLT